MPDINYILTEETLTAFVEGTPISIRRDHPRFDEAISAISASDVDGLKAIAEHMIQAVRGAGLVFEDGVVRFNDWEVAGALSKRLVEILELGLPMEPWKLFLANLYANPAQWSRDELYLWLEKSDLPITSDGHFLAYKVVQANYRDCHTGTMDNSPGKLVSLAGRRSVDPNRNRTCSYGLHFCSKSYLPWFGRGEGRVVLVKVNPADVVSIPNDHDNAKGRTFRYEVVGEVTAEMIETIGWGPIDDWNRDEDEYDPEEDEYYPDDEEVDPGDENGEPFPEEDDEPQFDAPPEVNTLTFTLPDGKRMTGDEFSALFNKLDRSCTKLSRAIGVSRGTLWGWLKRAGVQ